MTKQKPNALTPIKHHTQMHHKTHKTCSREKSNTLRLRLPTAHPKLPNAKKITLLLRHGPLNHPRKRGSSGSMSALPEPTLPFFPASHFWEPLHEPLTIHLEGCLPVLLDRFNRPSRAFRQFGIEFACNIFEPEGKILEHLVDKLWRDFGLRGSCGGFRWWKGGDSITGRRTGKVYDAGRGGKRVCDDRSDIPGLEGREATRFGGRSSDGILRRTRWGRKTMDVVELRLNRYSSRSHVAIIRITGGDGGRERCAIIINLLGRLWFMEGVELVFIPDGGGLRGRWGLRTRNLESLINRRATDRVVAGMRHSLRYQPKFRCSRGRCSVAAFVNPDDWVSFQSSEDRTDGFGGQGACTGCSCVFFG